jgi:hypothetical protein
MVGPIPTQREWHPVRAPRYWRPAHRAYLDAVAASARAERNHFIQPQERLSRADRAVASGLGGLAVLDRMVRCEPLGATPPVTSAAVPSILWRELEAAARFDVSLFSGHTGLLWTLAYTDPSTACAVEAAAASVASGLVAAGETAPMHFDLVLGAAGLLVLGRLVVRCTGDDRLTRAVSAWLAANAHCPSVWRTPTGPYRTTPPTVAGEFYYDWGVAHGIPGAVATLVHSELDLGRAEAAAQHLERFARAVGLVGLDQGFGPSRRPLLPTFSGPGGLQLGHAESWCYGDAGAGVVLALAALGTGIPRCSEMAHSFVEAADSALRRGAAMVEHLEPGLCHGVAGLALLAARLHQATGQARFADCAIQIVDRALELNMFDPDRVAAAHGQGLLCGVAGIGLALHALLSSQAPSWDMILGLS